MRGNRKRGKRGRGNDTSGEVGDSRRGERTEEEERREGGKMK